MNVYHIAVVNQEEGDLIPLQGSNFAAVFNTGNEFSVHGADNVRRAIALLKQGKSIQYVREMICPDCGNFKPCRCKFHGMSKEQLRKDTGYMLTLRALAAEARNVDDFFTAVRDFDKQLGISSHPFDADELRNFYAVVTK